MRPVKPIVPGLNLPVTEFAKEQPEYNRLPAFRSINGVVLSRWRLTWRERFLTFFRGDVYLSVHTFGHPLQPINLTIERPTYDSIAVNESVYAPGRSRQTIDERRPMTALIIAVLLSTIALSGSSRAFQRDAPAPIASIGDSAGSIAEKIVARAVTFSAMPFGVLLAESRDERSRSRIAFFDSRGTEASREYAPGIHSGGSGAVPDARSNLPAATLKMAIVDLVPQGGGTLRINATRADGAPAAGRTVITIISPCGQSMVIDDLFVDFSISEPGSLADGRLFDFIIPDTECHGCYWFTAVVYDSSGETLAGSVGFKYLGSNAESVIAEIGGGRWSVAGGR